MEYKQRPFAGENDIQEMMALARQHSSETFHIWDLPYRLSSWAMDDPRNACIWEDDSGRLLGWAVLQTPFWTLDYGLDPTLDQGLLPIILEWADERAAKLKSTIFGLPMWFTYAFEDQGDRIRILEADGYKSQADVGEDSWTKVLMFRAGSQPIPAHRVKEGIVIRPMTGVDEVEAYVDLHRSAFGTKNMTVEWRRRVLQCSEYNPELNIVAVDGGRLAAFCVGWLGTDDKGGLCGQVEPLGCHEDYRRFALGRAVLEETLRRMQSLGAGKIYVETDNYRDTAFRLYESIDFRVLRKVLIFRKDFP